ncbi:hypothetical protein [Geoalkalibacter halelectricus]|uniref:hypothetical protein n=1 Tax=Geoalkalibacter halelectricus TaxID=2847045 RepID=UPI003D22E0C5
MRKFIILVLAALLFFPLGVSAEVYELRRNLSVILPELPAPWTVSREASPALVEHLAEHLLEDAERAGRTLSKDDALRGARQRLATNDLMIFNEQSEAHVLISFSPIGRRDADPSADAVAISARYAAEGVSDEGWEKTAEEHRPVEVKGAQQAQYFKIEYTEDGDPHLFMGIVGYARPFWFWVYANDHLKDPADRPVLENILNNIEIRASR